MDNKRTERYKRAVDNAKKMSTYEKKAADAAAEAEAQAESTELMKRLREKQEKARREEQEKARRHTMHESQHGPEAIADRASIDPASKVGDDKMIPKSINNREGKLKQMGDGRTLIGGNKKTKKRKRKGSNKSRKKRKSRSKLKGRFHRK